MENKLELVDQIKKDYDDRYSLIIAKDHHKGVVVQVARMNPTHVTGNDGTVTKAHRPVVLSQRLVQLVIVQGPNTPPEFRSADDVKKELMAAIAQADDFAAKCIKSEGELDEILLAFNKQFNE